VILAFRRDRQRDAAFQSSVIDNWQSGDFLIAAYTALPQNLPSGQARKGVRLDFFGRPSSLTDFFKASYRSVQFYPPLFTHLLLFVDKEAAEHIQYNGEALHETEKIVTLLLGVARELKIFSRRPIDAMLVTKLPRSVRETVYISMARERAA
jgi:hypothetical protein